MACGFRSMIELYARSRKILAWSIYGFFLVFALFVTSNSYGQDGAPSATHVDNGYFASKSAASDACRIHRFGAIWNSCNVGGPYEEAQWETANGGYYCYSRLVKVHKQEGSLPQPVEHYRCADYLSNTFNVVSQTFHYFSYSLGSEPVDIVDMPDCSIVVGSVGSFSCFSPPVVCEQGEISADCGVECPATEWFPAGFVGHGQTCGAPSSGDGLASFTDNPVADYACVGSSGLLKCDTGLNNGQTGSGAGGSHAMSDTFYVYCLSNPSDVECGGTFAESPLPTCQNGQQADPQLGCDWIASGDTVCPNGQQINSNGACVDFAQVSVPIVAPNPAFVGGTVTGGSGTGTGTGTGDFDDSGIIDAVDKTTDAVKDGNAILSDQLDSLQSIEECLTGECGDLNLPNVLPNTQDSVETAFGQFQNRVSNAPIVAALGGIVNVANFGNGGTCPAFDLVLFGVPISTILHCDLWETVAPIISTFMMVYWTLVAWRKFTENF